MIAEVRSYPPYSNYSPQFDREVMSESLGKIGGKYVDLGKELGGRPGARNFMIAMGTSFMTRWPRRKSSPKASGVWKTA